VEEIWKRIRPIFIDIFDDNQLNINEESSADNIEEWDSLNHVNIVVAIEKEFKIKFALGELESLKNVGEMVQLISKKLAK